MVVDYNASTGRCYPPVNLDDPPLLMQGGLEPSESDPRFHQQMVYAVAMRTLENFDRALGRRLHLHQRGRPLRLFPHALYGANAYFDEDLHAIVFCQFRADSSDPGENLPGQTVFTCLSHDIVAHEMTHAIVNRLRRHFLEPSNADVLAFHEAFSDLVAQFQHFSFVDVVKAQVQKTGPDLSLAADLVRLARVSGLEPGALPSDLVNRLAGEAARIALSMLTMCIRAFDYLPPVDVSFGDFLRAMVTADFELSPDDERGQRAALIEGFRLRGIYPRGVTSLAEESLAWDAADRALPLLNGDPREMLDLIVDAANRLSPGAWGNWDQRPDSDSLASLSARQSAADRPTDGASSRERITRLQRQLHAYAVKNRDRLLLDAAVPIRPLGVPENPSDPDARRIRETQSRPALAMQAHWQARLAADGADATAERGLAIALNALSNDAAMTLLHSGYKSRPKPRDAADCHWPELKVDDQDMQAMRDAAEAWTPAVAVALKKAVNGSSLALGFEYEDAVLVFPGDAHWGTWDAFISQPRSRELLSRARFWKVGHHDSHNATPKDFVDGTVGPGCCAMVSVKRGKFASIPRQPRLDAIHARGIALARSDEPTKAPAKPFLRRTASIIETRIPVGTAS